MGHNFKPQTAKQDGFTLVELVITITVFAIIVPALASMLGQLDGVNDRARDLSLVNALVENKVEGLRSVSFSGLTNGTTDFSSELPVTVALPRSATYTVSTVNTALKQVDVSVVYNDHGQTRTVAYRTYVGELGVGQY
jgi:prepilin-type N-terminal cleavage/methylation domain-containing protein